MLIDDFLPAYHEAERHETMVRAPAERVYSVLRALDVAGPPVNRLLFLLRGLPSAGRLGLEELQRHGFVLLGEDPPRELVLGLVARPWRPTGGVLRVDPKAFRGFDRPGFAVIAWNFWVTPGDDDSSLLGTETRVRCTDEPSRIRFRRYWRVIGPASGVVRAEALRAVRRAAEAAGG